MDDFNLGQTSQKKEWKGVFIPKELWENSTLSWMEKLFWCEIDGLDNEFGCYASNNHFSGVFGLSKNRCSEIINSLVIKGFVSCDFEREEERITKRTLRIIPLSKKYKKIEAPRKRIKIVDSSSGKLSLSPGKRPKIITRTPKKIVEQLQAEVRERAANRLSN